MHDPTSSQSRRNFIAGAISSFALSAAPKVLAAHSPTAFADSRVSSAPLIDRGFASVRKVGAGVYATISDPSKGAQTTCNGGFLVGRDAGFLIEGFNSPAGASFQFDALRLATRVPIRAALDTHFHYDHSMGNHFYRSQRIPLWAHTDTATRITETYGVMQSRSKEETLAPFEKRITDAKTELARAHAQSDLAAVNEILASARASKLGLPTRPLDRKELPLTVDLGGLTALLEYHPGHSGTDIIVRVPDQNIVFTGDLLFQGKYPVTFDPKASISAWRDTLTHFATFDKDTLFVPGHGQRCGQEAIATTLAVFDDIAEQTAKLFRAGTPLPEAKDLYVVPDRFMHYSIWSWGFVIGSAIELLYAEMSNQS
ncbi:MAG TPA: MBL fold metallo-hydrolase [Terracidiphilus sp.]|nr:MBL fold metallo-hydrolase [Terracidiphilus sp.]